MLETRSGSMGLPTPPYPQNSTGNYPEKDFRGATAKAGAPFFMA